MGVTGFVAFIKEEDMSCYFVWKHYYCLKASPDVKRMIIFMVGFKEVLECCYKKVELNILRTEYEKEVLNLALVQYYYSQGEHKLKVAKFSGW